MTDHVDELPIARKALRDLLDRTADAIVVVDGEGVVLYANLAAEGLLGRGIEGGLAGHSFGFPLVPDTNAEIDLLSRSGEPVVAEMRVVTTKWADQPVSLAIVRDLTERRGLFAERLRRERAEAERAQIAAERDRLDVLARAYESLNHSIELDASIQKFLEVLTESLADAAGVVLQVSGRNEFLQWDQSRHEAAGGFWKRILPALKSESGWVHDEGDQSGVRPRLDDVASSPILPIRIGGKVVGVLVLINEHRPIRGNDLRLLLTLRDSLQSAIDRSLVHERTTEESALRDRFFAKISHEIRNAVQALGGWAQLLGEILELEGDAADGISAIRNNTRVLGRLATDMVEVSQMLSGKLSIRTSVIDLNRVVRQSISTMVPAAEEAGIELVDETRDPEGSLIEGDDSRLQQVFQNLIGNAIRYTPGGGRITVSTEFEMGLVRALVTDNGEGINPEEASVLFDAFQQGASGKGRRGGLGLGLTIGKEIVSLHNGVLSFSSEGQGRGSTFVVELPLASFTDPGQGRN